MDQSVRRLARALRDRRRPIETAPIHWRFLAARQRRSNLPLGMNALAARVLSRREIFMLPEEDMSFGVHERADAKHLEECGRNLRTTRIATCRRIGLASDRQASARRVDRNGNQVAGFPE